MDRSQQHSTLKLSDKVVALATAPPFLLRTPLTDQIGGKMFRVEGSTHRKGPSWHRPMAAQAAGELGGPRTSYRAQIRGRRRRYGEGVSDVRVVAFVPRQFWFWVSDVRNPPQNLENLENAKTLPLY